MKALLQASPDGPVPTPSRKRFPIRHGYANALWFLLSALVLPGTTSVLADTVVWRHMNYMHHEYTGDVEDTFIRGDLSPYDGNNHGGSDVLGTGIRWASGSGHQWLRYRSLIRFTGFVPHNHVVKGPGTLELTVYEHVNIPAAWGAVDVYAVGAADGTWRPYVCTWRGHSSSMSTPWTGGPGLGSPGLGYGVEKVGTLMIPPPEAITSGVTKVECSIPQHLIQRWLNDSRSNYGLLLRTRAESPSYENLVRFYSSDAGDLGSHDPFDPYPGENDPKRPTLTFQSGMSRYASWASGYPLSPQDARPSADPDGDGVLNGGEYAFGTNPTLSNAVSTVETTVSNNYLWVRATLDPTADGVSLDAPWSPDLASWSMTGTTVIVDSDDVYFARTAYPALRNYIKLRVNITH